MKILITGGCGYIGSHTAVDLLEKGHEVISADDFSRGKKYVPEHVFRITGKQMQNFNIDLTELSRTREFFKEQRDIEGIIHFAAYKMVGESVEQPMKYYYNNLVSLINILKCRSEFDIPYFIFSSSSAVYGNIDQLPVSEDSTVSQQESPYGRSKYFGEKIISDIVQSESFYAVILRYFNPVGSHDSSLLGEPIEDHPMNIVPAITGTASGRQAEFVVNGGDYQTRDGSCIRDYIHVMDVAHAHTLALEFLVRKKSEGLSSFQDTINLGTGNGISVLEMISAFEKVTGKKLQYRIGPRRAGDAIAVYSENKKAHDVLGWSTKRTLEDIMRSAWEWEKAIDGKRETI